MTVLLWIVKVSAKIFLHGRGFSGRSMKQSDVDVWLI